METSERVEDPTKAVRAAGVILLLRGTGLACAGLIAAATLFPEGDPVLGWTTIPLAAGVLLALLALPAMRGRRLVLVLAAPLALAWVSLALWTAWQARHAPLWLSVIPAFFLPDLYALWTILRGRGRPLVARAMVALSALSSLVLSWLGAAFFLA